MIEAEVGGPDFKIGFNHTCGPDQFWCSFYACEDDLVGFYMIYAPTAQSNLTGCFGIRLAGGEPGSQMGYNGGIAVERY